MFVEFYESRNLRLYDSSFFIIIEWDLSFLYVKLVFEWN